MDRVNITKNKILIRKGNRVCIRFLRKMIAKIKKILKTYIKRKTKITFLNHLINIINKNKTDLKIRNK
jgi:hypothetical protein